MKLFPVSATFLSDIKIFQKTKHNVKHRSEHTQIYLTSGLPRKKTIFNVYSNAVTFIVG